MPWGPNVPKWVQRYVKVYYAVCQLFATTALLLVRVDLLKPSGHEYCSICGSLVLDSAFAIMFPIQLSTFLMTLVMDNGCKLGLCSQICEQVRKNLISGTSWHVWYALSLGSVFMIPISHSIR